MLTRSQLKGQGEDADVALYKCASILRAPRAQIIFNALLFHFGPFISPFYLADPRASERYPTRLKQVNHLGPQYFSLLLTWFYGQNNHEI